MKKFAFILGTVAAAGAANAVFFETEVNNTFGSAQILSRPAGTFSDVGVCSLVLNDVDFFAINLVAGEVFTVITTPLGANLSVPDTMMGIFDNTTAMVAFNDDAGTGSARGSAIRYEVLSTGTYYIGVTGFPDNNFVGAHPEQGQYLLTMSAIAAVPEPASMAALGLGAVALIRRRRSK